MPTYKASKSRLFIMSSIGLALMIPAWSTSGTASVIIYYPFWIIGAVIIVKSIAAYIGAQLELTDSALVIKSGVVFKKITTIPYQKITSVQASNVFGKTGSITIATSDSTEKVKFQGVYDVHDCQNRLNQKIAERKDDNHEVRQQ